MKQKKQTPKKLSLKKLQVTKIINPHLIKGGGGLNNYDGDEPTGTGKTR
ncbi:hypothetical protein [Chryseobacterium sp.]|nr:hypothetical protein [Chryseobacterium sp.]